MVENVPLVTNLLDAAVSVVSKVTGHELGTVLIQGDTT
jgi:hypothetical protein